MVRTIKGYSIEKPKDIFKNSKVYICTAKKKKDCDKLGRCGKTFPFACGSPCFNKEELALRLRKPISKLTINDYHAKPQQISQRAYKKCRKIKIVVKIEQS